MKKFSINPTYFFLLLFLAPLGIAPAVAQGLVQEELVRLIALHGPAVEETLESFPEVQARMNGNSSSLTAVQKILRKEAPEKQKEFLERLSRTLSLRDFLEEESKDLPNGLYELFADIPELKKIADKALDESGMAPSQTRAAYDVTSNMSTYQGSHMLTCVALHLSDLKPAQEQSLRAKIKAAAKSR